MPSTHLQLLVMFGQKKVLGKLIAEGKCDVNEKDEHNTSLVHMASIQNNMDILQQLVGAGARVDVIDDFKQTPLSIATEKGHTEVAKYIEETLEGYRRGGPGS